MSGLDAWETEQGLNACVAVGLIDDADKLILSTSYDMCWSLQLASRLLSSKVFEPDELGQGAASFVCRAMGFEDLTTLELELTNAFQLAKDVIDRVVDVDSKKDANDEG